MGKAEEAPLRSAFQCFHPSKRRLIGEHGAQMDDKMVVQGAPYQFTNSSVSAGAGVIVEAS